jgi:hypothetical protein
MFSWIYITDETVLERETITIFYRKSSSPFLQLLLLLNNTVEMNQLGVFLSVDKLKACVSTGLFFG